MNDLSYIRHLVFSGKWSTARAEAAGDIAALAYVREHTARAAAEASEGFMDHVWVRFHGCGGGYGSQDFCGDGVGFGEGANPHYGELHGRGGGGGDGRYWADGGGDGHGDGDVCGYGDEGDGFGDGGDSADGRGGGQSEPDNYGNNYAFGTWT